LDKNESCDEKQKADTQKGHAPDWRQQIYVSVHQKPPLSIEAKRFA
jgi:hypothetical protein